jgi:alkylation response protein AidB-like acyl-CoA dehydrogenase
MDTRDTAEQAELRRSARQLARELGPATVADLDDATRAKRLSAAVRDAGWLELRADGGDGTPLAGAAEAAIVAEALGATVADAAFAGPVLAGDLARRASVQVGDGTVVAFAPSLVDLAVVHGGTTAAPLHVIDGGGEVDSGFVLTPEGSGHRLARLGLDGADDSSGTGSDLTRSVRTVAARAPVVVVPDQDRLLTDDDLALVRALGLALTSADLVGVMRGVLDVTVAYAAERQQYGVPIGSFQAVQHLLAEARCLMEGSHSVALHASWAVDNLPPDDALTAGRVAKAYCGRAARTVGETAIQVHGGIGNTWECIVNVYLRRALLSSRWFGDVGEQLRELERTRLGVGDGLS